MKILFSYAYPYHKATKWLLYNEMEFCMTIIDLPIYYDQMYYPYYDDIWNGISTLITSKTRVIKSVLWLMSISMPRLIKSR